MWVIRFFSCYFTSGSFPERSSSSFLPWLASRAPRVSSRQVADIAGHSPSASASASAAASAADSVAVFASVSSASSSKRPFVDVGGYSLALEGGEWPEIRLPDYVGGAEGVSVTPDAYFPATAAGFTKTGDPR